MAFVFLFLSPLNFDRWHAFQSKGQSRCDVTNFIKKEPNLNLYKNNFLFPYKLKSGHNITRIQRVLDGRFRSRNSRFLVELRCVEVFYLVLDPLDGRLDVFPRPDPPSGQGFNDVFLIHVFPVEKGENRDKMA